MGESICEVPDTGMFHYWWILEYFLCTSIASKCDIYVFLEHASVIQMLTILEHKNGVVLSKTGVSVFGTWNTLFFCILFLTHSMVKSTADNKLYFLHYLFFFFFNILQPENFIAIFWFGMKLIEVKTLLLVQCFFQ